MKPVPFSARRFPLKLILAICLILTPASVSAETEVLVYGATPGGIAAAVAAAKGGHDVLLVEPTSRIGGLLTCGLTHSDFRSFESLKIFIDGSYEGDLMAMAGESFHVGRESRAQISYGVIVPQASENLLVPVACSASHFGFSALRLEPIWSSLGQAAGWAAHIAISEQVRVQDVNVATLQDYLHEDRSATIYVTDVPPSSPDFSAVQWWGNQGGLHGLVELDSPRKAKNMTGQYFEAFPDHAAELDKPLTPELRTRWEKLLPPGMRISADVNTRADWVRALTLTLKTP